MRNDAWMSSMLRILAGIACLLVGVIGLLIPILPGIPLLIAAAILLKSGRRSPHRVAGLTLFERVKLGLLRASAALLDRLERWQSGSRARR